VQQRLEGLELRGGEGASTSGNDSPQLSTASSGRYVPSHRVQKFHKILHEPVVSRGCVRRPSSPPSPRMWCTTAAAAAPAARRPRRLSCCARPPRPQVDLDALRELSWNGIPGELRPQCWRLLLGYVPPNK
jgi:hypothetical protein